MTSAVKEMAETCSTWKKGFNHWMTNCSQDKDEQLQRFRKAM